MEAKLKLVKSPKPELTEDPRERAAREVLHELMGEHWMEYVGFNALGLNGEVSRCRICGETESHRGPGY